MREPAPGLNPNCWWMTTERGRYLHWAFGCIAWAERREEGVVYLIIWGGHVHRGACRRMDTAVRYITRWVAKRRGFPGKPRKRHLTYRTPERFAVLLGRPLPAGENASDRRGQAGARL